MIAIILQNKKAVPPTLDPTADQPSDPNNSVQPMLPIVTGTAPTRKTIEDTPINRKMFGNVSVSE